MLRRPVLRSLAQMLVMAAIVTTALFVPLGAAVALLVIALSGVPLRALLGFGGALSVPAGLAAWWAIFFVPALVYSAYAMPWPAHEEPPGH